MQTYFYVHLSSNQWQKLSQDVRCCVQNCSLVLVCMYVYLFVCFLQFVSTEK